LIGGLTKLCYSAKELLFWYYLGALPQSLQTYVMFLSLLRNVYVSMAYGTDVVLGGYKYEILKDPGTETSILNVYLGEKECIKSVGTVGSLESSESSESLESM